MRLKLHQWHILRKYALFSNLLIEPKLKVERFFANQNKINKWTNDFFFIISNPFRKENPKMYSCSELVWNDPIGLLEPNTYECPIRTIRTYWAEILIFDKKWVAQPNTYEWLWLSKSYRYWSSSLWKFISSLRTTRSTAISSKDNSTHRNFVQGQLDPRQFRPRTTRPTAISSKDNSTNGNFVHIQSWLSLQGLVEGHPPPS